MTETPYLLDYYYYYYLFLEIFKVPYPFKCFFLQVLSASDLKLLVHLCEKLDPDKVFLEPCLIEQHILLSFIQQLSVDLNIQTDLKHRLVYFIYSYQENRGRKKI